MRLVIPEEFISEPSGDGKCDVRIPTVGDLVNRRSPDRFPFITMDEKLLSKFDAKDCPELSDKYRCMTVNEGVFELNASAVDILTGRANGITEVLDLQDIRSGCSAYIAGQVIPREELLQNGGMMYQYTKYLTSNEPMVESMQSLIREHVEPAVSPQADNKIAQRNTRDLDAAVSGISEGAAAEVELST